MKQPKGYDPVLSRTFLYVTSRGFSFQEPRGEYSKTRPEKKKKTKENSNSNEVLFPVIPVSKRKPGERSFLSRQDINRTESVRYYSNLFPSCVKRSTLTWSGKYRREFLSRTSTRVHQITGDEIPPTSRILRPEYSSFGVSGKIYLRLHIKGFR